MCERKIYNHYNNNNNIKHVWNNNNNNNNYIQTTKIISPHLKINCYLSLIPTPCLNHEIALNDLTRTENAFRARQPFPLMHHMKLFDPF